MLWIGSLKSGFQVVGAMDREFRIWFAGGYCYGQGVLNLVFKWLVLWIGSLESGLQKVSAMDRNFRI